MRTDSKYKGYQVFLNYCLIRIFVKEISSIKAKSILIIAPHPDDEILGIGGTLIKSISFGSKTHIVYLTDGEGSGVWHDKEEIRQKRILLSEKICERLNLKLSNITRLHLTDGALPHPGHGVFQETVEKIKQLIEEFKPDAVFATHTLDYWPFDHVACAHIARYAVNLSEHKTQLWYYWVWAWYNIRPCKGFKIIYKKTRIIKIKEHMQKKKVLMDLYLTSLTPHGKPWSGILPKSLLKAFAYSYEVIERII